jgi:hypothetical protein
MKATLVYTITSSDHFDVFHYCMFHGEASRPGIIFPMDPSHKLGSDLSQPLLLRCNAHRMPDVFYPHCKNLIVSESVRTALTDLPNIVFLPVIFEKLVDYPYAVGDFSYYDRPAFQKTPRKEDPETLIDRLPDVPALRGKIGSYYEMVVDWVTDIAHQYSDRRAAEFTVNKLGDDEIVQLPVSEQLLRDYPVAWGNEGVLFSDQSFSRIQKLIDWDFFRKSEAIV